MFQIRGYDPGDWNEFRKFYRVSLGHVSTSEKNSGLDWTLAKRMERPGFQPEKDIAVAVREDKIIGFLLIISEARIKRLVIEICVSPSERGRGLGTALLEMARKKAERANAFFLHINIPAGERPGVQDFLNKRGFRQVRCHETLGASIQPLSLREPDSSSVKSGYFSPGEEAKLADLQNRIFEESWGFCPNTSDDIKFYLELTRCPIKEVLVFQEKEDAAGYVWPHFFHPDAPERQRDECRIHMMGVLSQKRRQGMGKLLLSSALANLSGKGFSRVELTVDDKNLPAKQLYRSLRFALKTKSYWYEYSL